MKAAAVLRTGQVLKIDNRHVVPDVDHGTSIVVNVPQRMLFFMKADGTVEGFPVAAGRPTWKTPLGPFTIASKEVDPTWDVPVSIQGEMARAGKPVVTRVPPSPDNPLGKYWIGLSVPAVGIHGTNAPSSIYGLVTHGCIRLAPENIAALFPEVDVGMRGRIAYEPILVGRSGNSVFLEAHPDKYKRGVDALAVVIERAKVNGFLDMLDLTLVQEVIQKRDGIARDVTRR